MLLERTSNNISQAAAIAGLERHSLRELLRKHGLYQAKD
jgi:DNA-binding protein Fis